MARVNDECQLNVRVPSALRKKIQVEAIRTNKTSELIVTAALQDFFRSWSLSERARFYTSRPYARRSQRPRPAQGNPEKRNGAGLNTPSCPTV